MPIRKQSILNPRTAKAHKYWYSLKPKQRLNLMREAKIKNKSTLGQFREVITYIEKNKKLR